jgi:4-amino-4-deoxy-L-arabinose transferase-like glycosyltransferase
MIDTKSLRSAKTTETGRLAEVAGTILLLALAIAWHVRGLLDWATRSPFDFDAKKYYIPYARRLLDEGWSFFTSVDALHVPPFSFVFPALFGADLALQKQVGIVLSSLAVLMLFRIGCLLHSRCAGLAAALLFAFSPVPLPFMSTGSVEPLFVFLLMSWTWGMAEGVAAERRWGFIVAGVAVGLASLTRATLLYYLPMVILLSLVLRRLQPGVRAAWNGILLTHSIGIAMIAPFLIRNLLSFGLPAISTGAGVALYNGNHSLTWGFDPGYFGVTFDFGILGREGASHLDPDTDRTLLGAGRRILDSYDLAFLAKMYAIKLLSFLFVGNLEWLAPVSELRSWRVVLLCFSAVTLPRLWKQPVLLVIAGSVLFQVAAHIPVLYSHRYSVAVLDAPLALLAGIGALTVLRHWSWRAQLSGTCVVLAAVAFGIVVANTSQVLQINIDGTPHVTVMDRSRENLQMSAGSGALPIGPGRVRTTAGVAEIDFDLTIAPIEAGRTYVLALDGALDSPMNRPSSCMVVYLYRTGSDAFSRERGIATSWNTDGRSRRIYNGVSEHIRIQEPGWLRLQFHCGEGATIDISRIALVQPFFSFDVFRKYFIERGVLKPG